MERKMNSDRQNQNSSLAYQLGVCRIALVVDRFYSQMQAHPTLREPFAVRGHWGDCRARLTYFWWVTLGGNKIPDHDFEMVPSCVRAGLNSEMMREWTTLFRQVARSVVGEQLANAWMEVAERVGRKLASSNENYLNGLAKAS
jgi:hemoglobin